MVSGVTGIFKSKDNKGKAASETKEDKSKAASEVKEEKKHINEDDSE